MPDARTYLWVARTVGSGNAGYGEPGKTFAVGLGCDIRHAYRLVYSRGLDLADPAMATPIGAGCKVCERPNCLQRAFPPIGRPVMVAVAQRDTIVPARFGEALYASLGEPRRLAVIGGAGHNDWTGHVDTAWWQEAVAFLLSPPPTTNK